MRIDLKKLDEVKPCPFCGNNEVIKLVIDDNPCDRKHRILCDKCGARSGECEEPEEAIRRWNRRISEVVF